MQQNPRKPPAKLRIKTQKHIGLWRHEDNSLPTLIVNDFENEAIECKLFSLPLALKYTYLSKECLRKSDRISAVGYYPFSLRDSLGFLDGDLYYFDPVRQAITRILTDTKGNKNTIVTRKTINTKDSIVTMVSITMNVGSGPLKKGEINARLSFGVASVRRGPATVDESEVLAVLVLREGGDVDPYMVVAKLLLRDRERVLSTVLDLLEGVEDLSHLEEVRRRLVSALQAVRDLRRSLPTLDFILGCLGGEA